MKKKIKVAIAGFGNCASSFVQAIYAAKSNKISETSPGVMHPNLGGYGIKDIEIVCVFDINKHKVGQDIAHAIKAPPNCTTIYYDLPKTGIIVKKSPILDGLNELLSSLIEIDFKQEPVDVSKELKKAGAEILINLLPVGSTQAVEHFAEACLDARVAFINCMPEKIATNIKWIKKFEDAKIPLLGDDMKSQLGATTLHKSIIDACLNKGAKIINTYQLNFGGNTDFMNMQTPSRKESKRYTKVSPIKKMLKDDVEISVGPSDYVPFLKDNKVAYIRIEGNLLLGMNFSIETRLSVEDSPNAAGVIIDAVRGAKVALDRGVYGPINEVSSFLFKNPPKDFSENESKKVLIKFCKEPHEC
jgi:myo-inositol-1-phosphate synthase